MHIMSLDISIVDDRQTKTKELRAHIEERAKIGLHKMWKKFLLTIEFRNDCTDFNKSYINMSLWDFKEVSSLFFFQSLKLIKGVSYINFILVHKAGIIFCLDNEWLPLVIEICFFFILKIDID